MAIFIQIIHVFVALFLVLVVLLQSGRGGGMGAAFGGASGQIFGGRGAAPFLAKVTTGAAIVFFLTSMSLSAISSRHRSVLLAEPGATAASTASEAASANDAPTKPHDLPTEPAGSDDMKAGAPPPAAVDPNS